MTIMNYRDSILIARQDWSFYGIIMTAMLQADADNLVRLEAAFPEVYRELFQRNNAPAGCLTHAETKWLRQLRDEEAASEEE